MRVMKVVRLPPPPGWFQPGLTSLGIDVVRNRIKGFAQKKVTLPQGRHKLVILDEADRLVTWTDPVLNMRLTLIQYDRWCSASSATYHGNLLIHHPLRFCL
jgi:hypothetical protein